MSGDGPVNLIVRLAPDVRRRFKAATAARDLSMQHVTVMLILRWLEENALEKEGRP